MDNIPKLFGTSGIRGKYQDEITLELALDVARALAKYIGGEDKKVVIGYDTRTTGKLIAHIMTAGLEQSGCNVLLLGMVPTPTVGYATLKKEADAGIMITASHNPSQYNGIKLWNADGLAYKQEQEREIERIVYEKEFNLVGWDKIGKEYDISSFKEEYINDIIKISEIDPEKPLKVVVDCASGAGSYLSPEALRKSGMNVITLNSQPDGFFPGRNPEPNSDNLQELMKTVKTIGADVGLAHDGDADRMIAVDENGNLSDFDKLLTIIAKEFGGTVVTTVDASACLDTEMEKIGGTVLRTPVGDVHVAESINENNGTFGGEPSGTWLHPDFCMCPDGLLSGLRIVRCIQKNGKLSEQLNAIENYPTIREKITCENNKKDEVMKVVSSDFKNEFNDVTEILTIDGVRIKFKDGSWVLIRPSGTEPYIRITAEGKTQEHLNDIEKISKKFLNNLI
ncbi:phosphoglucosamine mutase [Methanosphaera sp. WGK6]|uniref:phosphoglucosamine mutase n=1 Tax=Methanosphaera sp. WGK6 TaxID=1561964 RepID=UPI00084C2E11|nr:phosphoglucosamine mutase [Methanosphaera sp. WGK6]OED30635.1 phosphoglucosamine mutase [Methanosphaera sp. WGK6]